MEKEYVVKVITTFEQTITVTAENRKDAKEQVEAQVFNGEIALFDADDFETKVEVVYEK